ncbi:hypothetical protein [Brevifollis gellanilyticus]|uniref:Uncharacterized protein n=1 Tax=Brevifollis gellanilyticus TaxID=748831 RepID=A0A512MB28_9BACT|nr:hypothetical protein [Brevifollis gellanilyticus]GEP43928.1 hypothetical protein BGE01nite_32190 [Brevifollis gellanilyticus]
MKHPISTILCLLSLAFLVWLGSFGTVLIWDGAIWKDVPIRVVTFPGGSAKSGVRVMLMMNNNFESFLAQDNNSRRVLLESAETDRLSAITDHEGRVVLRGMFPAGGHKSLFVKRGHYGISGHIAIIRDTEVIAQYSLATLLPNVRRKLSDKLPEIELPVNSSTP